MFSFLTQLKARLLNYVATTRPYEYLVREIIPPIRFSTKYGAIDGWQYDSLSRFIKDGDVILCTDNLKLSQMFVSGKWNHAAISVDGKFAIAQMTGIGFNYTTLYDLCRQSDNLCIVRCKDWDSEYVKNVINKEIDKYQDSKYDIGFDLTNKQFYCSELIWKCDTEKRANIKPSRLKSINKLYFKPDSFYESGNFEVIAETSN